MTVITTAGWVERHRHIVASFRAGTTVSANTIVAELREGWDLTVSGPTSPIGLLGIPRVPHIAILGDVPATAMPGRPILAESMTAQEIEAGLYRQCRIRPEALADGTSVAEDPYTILDDDAYDPGRAWVFRALTGHAPCDVGLFLADQLQRRPDIGKRLLAKDFVTALAEAPDLHHATWPDRVRAGWRENGGKNYLPPMLVLALHAELARWSLNDLGMIALSFDADGTAITTQTLIADIMPAAAANDRATVMPHPTPIDALVGMVPFQTYTLLPPTAVFASRDESAGRAWSQACASLIPSVIADHGPTLIDDMMTFTGHLTPTALQANIRAHPKAWPEPRKGYGYSPQKRPAVEYWGLDRRQNAAVGLLEIARDAQAWNGTYAAAEGNLREDVSEKFLANAMQTVLCLWLEDAHALAANQLYREIREGFRDKATREPTVFANETLDDVCRRPGFGSGLLRTARALIARRAKPGKEGYSARAKAHLWIAAIGDDLGWYLDLQRRAVAEQYHREDCTDRSPPRRQDDLFSRYRNQRSAPAPLGMPTISPTASTSSPYKQAVKRANLCAFPVGQPGWTQGFRFEAWLRPGAELAFLRNCCRYIQYDPAQAAKRDTYLAEHFPGSADAETDAMATAAELPRQHPLERIQDLFRRFFDRLQIAELAAKRASSHSRAWRESALREVASLLAAVSPITVDPYLNERMLAPPSDEQQELARKVLWNM